MIANYHSIETFSGVDGPGIRYVLFLQGCNLRCKFCHNADTIPDIQNKSISVEEVVSDYMKYKFFYLNGGGITITGGEPLLQIDFIIALFTELKKYNVHTCIETQGTLYNDNPKFQRLIELTDLFMVDLKGVDNKYALDISGRGINNTLKFLNVLNKNNRKFAISYVLLPGINDNDYCVDRLAAILNSFDANNMSFKINPYHRLGVEKWRKINVPYLLNEVKEPTHEEVESFIRKIETKLHNEGVKFTYSFNSSK